MSCQASSRKGPPEGHLTTLSGAFYGDALDRVQLEAQFAQFWKPKWIEREIDRVRSTWFDYRHAHPVLRSHYFIHEYTLAYRRAWRRFYDHKANTTGMHPWRAKRSLYSQAAQTITQVINLMHTVDEACMPYDIFFDGAIEHFMQEREFARVWTKARGLQGLKLPPLRVLKDGEALIHAQKIFDRRNRTKLRLAKHPHYFADAWLNSQSQQDYVRYLFNEARKREGNLVYVLAALVYDRGIVREHEVARKFGIEMVKSIRVYRD